MSILRSRKQFFSLVGFLVLSLAMVVGGYFVTSEMSFDDRGEASSPPSFFRPLSWEVKIGENKPFTESEPSYVNPAVHTILPKDEIKVSLFVDTQSSDIDSLEIGLKMGDLLKYSHSKFDVELGTGCDVEVVGVDRLLLYCFFLKNDVGLESYHLVDLYFSPPPIPPLPHHPPGEHGGSDSDIASTSPVVNKSSFSISDIEFSYSEGVSKHQSLNLDRFNPLTFLYKVEVFKTACRTSEDCSRIAPYEVCFKGVCYKGDVNNDGKINVLDFSEFKKDFVDYKSLENTRFVDDRPDEMVLKEIFKRSDLNNDKSIGMADYGIFVRSFRILNGISSPISCEEDVSYAKSGNDGTVRCLSVVTSMVCPKNSSYIYDARNSCEAGRLAKRGWEKVGGGGGNFVSP